MAEMAENQPHPAEPGAEEKPGERPTPVIPLGNVRLAETLKHGDRIYQLMVDAVRDYAIFMLDPNGYVASWNRGAERLKGYKANEIIGRHFSVFYPPADIASEKPQLELEGAIREGRFEDEGWRLRNDGTQFWANVIITPVHDDDGSLVGFAKVTRDLTERRAAELKAIADARRLAESEAANIAKSEFLTAMSHELRTPLNAIAGYTELLTLGLGGPVSTEQNDYLDRIRRSQRHLMGIITDLLNFSRIEAGHLTYAIAPIPLPDIIASVSALVEPQAEAKGIVFEIDSSSQGCVALGDRPKVDQIVLNLLSNAIKFTGPKGKMRIECSTTESSASISVVDTGVGIPADKLESIFEPFVQLGRSLSSAHEGMGLGLAISRDLARAMDGDLTVKSTVGTGSTFTLILPRYRADTAAKKPTR